MDFGETGFRAPAEVKRCEVEEFPATPTKSTPRRPQEGSNWLQFGRILDLKASISNGVSACFTFKGSSSYVNQSCKLDYFKGVEGFHGVTAFVASKGSVYQNSRFNYCSIGGFSSNGGFACFPSRGFVNHDSRFNYSSRGSSGSNGFIACFNSSQDCVGENTRFNKFPEASNEAVSVDQMIQIRRFNNWDPTLMGRNLMFSDSAFARAKPSLNDLSNAASGVVAPGEIQRGGGDAGSSSLFPAFYPQSNGSHQEFDTTGYASACFVQGGNNNAVGNPVLGTPFKHSNQQQQSHSELLASLNSNTCANNRRVEDSHCGFHVPIHPFYNFNSMGKMMGGAMLNKNIEGQGVPVTPDHKSTVPVQNCEVTANEKGVKQFVVDLTVDEDGANEAAQDKTPSEPGSLSSLDVPPTPSKENCNSKMMKEPRIDINLTPPQKSEPKPRRKKHRPKIAYENKPKKSPKAKQSSPKETSPKEKPQVKRKYVRRKGVNASNTPSGGHTKVMVSPPVAETEVPTTRSNPKRARRALNFDLESQPSELDAGITLNHQEQSSPGRLDSRHGYNNQVQDLHQSNKRSFANVAIDLNRCCSQMLNDCMSLLEESVPITRQKNSEENVCEVMDKGKQLQGEKREHSNASGISEINLLSSSSASIPVYQNFYGRHGYLKDNDNLELNFPKSCKRKRTEKGRIKLVPRTWFSKKTSEDSMECSSFPKSMAREPSLLEKNVSPKFSVGRITHKIQGKSKIMSVLGKAIWKKKRKRSQRPQVRNIISLIALCNQFREIFPTTAQAEIFQGAQGRFEKLLSFLAAHAKILKKPRSKRIRRVDVSSLCPVHLGHGGASKNYCRDLTISEGSKRTSEIHEQKQVVPFAFFQSENSLVPYRHDEESVVHYIPKKEQKPRVKVDMDDFTVREFKLQMGYVTPSSEDFNPEKVRHWAGERQVFMGRVERILQIMGCVQGDRRFTPWKGSVIDSVVGVFLTQNVSDFLSSSAFMNLAAFYPLLPPSNHRTWYKNGTSMYIEEPEMDRSNAEDASHNSPNSVLQPIERPGHMNMEDRYLLFQHISSMLDGTSIMRLLSMPPAGVRPNPYSDERLRFIYAHSLYAHSQALQFNNGRHCIGGINGPNGTFICHPFMQVGNDSFASLTGQLTQPLITSSQQAETEKHPNLSNNLQREGSKISVPEETSTTRPQDCAEALDQRSKGRVVGNQSNSPETSNGTLVVGESMFGLSNNKCMDNKISELNLNEKICFDDKVPDAINDSTAKVTKKSGKEENATFDWDSLRKEAEDRGIKRERTRTQDSVDWEAVRCANVKDIAAAIELRGMQNVLAQRIQDMLNRIVKEHGSLDLEWLRDVHPDKAKDFLLSIRGLGLKSVECVRLLTLHHHAFPVDTNVARIVVRLGWVPLLPLPEDLQLHDLQEYPYLDQVQKYLWPRLCKFDQKTLYELHYQMITFGKVFCTKRLPNCNACPLRAECRHFASACASTLRALPAPVEKHMVPSHVPMPADRYPTKSDMQLSRHLPQANLESGQTMPGRLSNDVPTTSLQPIVEEEPDIEDCGRNPEEDLPYDDNLDDDDDVLHVDIRNVNNIMQQNNVELQGDDLSKVLALSHPFLASLVLKEKTVARLRTEHQVYLIPDEHQLLKQLHMPRREPDDPCNYLLKIWLPGEYDKSRDDTAGSTQPPTTSGSEEASNLFIKEKCSPSDGILEEHYETHVRGTLLIPSRTAMRGGFPLNGTYFQCNEVFADHESSRSPMKVPRQWLWNLERRRIYCGTSVTSIFRGLPMNEIQYCFQQGYVCVRAFERETGAPRPLTRNLHIAPGLLGKLTNKGRANKEKKERI